MVSKITVDYLKNAIKHRSIDERITLTSLMVSASGILSGRYNFIKKSISHRVLLYTKVVSAENQ